MIARIQKIGNRCLSLTMATALLGLPVETFPTMAAEGTTPSANDGFGGLDLLTDLRLPPAAEVSEVTFAKDIQPIFEKSCVQCHGAEKQKGKYRLDTLDAALKGGGSGEVIIKGASAKSPLVVAVARLDPDSAMPPDGKIEPLTSAQVGLIRAWIDRGAK